MTIAEIIELEIQMREDLARLEQELADGEEATDPPEALDGTIGRLSRQDSMLQQEVAKDGQRRRIRRMTLLSEALERMDNGTYGFCVNCKEPISDQRLTAIPEAFLCVNCGV